MTTLAALSGLSLAALAAAAPADAQTYGAQSRYAPAPSATSYQDCVRQQRNRQVAGAVIGGILGAVVGAELHDDAQDRARADRRYHGGRYYRGRGYHHGRYDRRWRRGYHYEEGNDGAVGALAGAAIAGRSDCDRHARTGYGYGAAPGHYGYDQTHGQSRGYSRGAPQPIYDEYGRAYDGGYGYDGGYAYDQRSSGELLGGEDYRRDSRTYAAGSAPAGPVYAASTGPCREMRSGNGALVLMCQGPDGIWRPA
jgi:hypothetical protein